MFKPDAYADTSSLSDHATLYVNQPLLANRTQSRGVSSTPSKGSIGLDGPVPPEEERNAFRALLCMAHTRFNPASSGNRWVKGGESRMTTGDTTFSLPHSEHHGSRRLVPGGPR